MPDITSHAQPDVSASCCSLNSSNDAHPGVVCGHGQHVPGMNTACRPVRPVGLTRPHPAAEGAAGLPYRQPLITPSAVTSAEARCSPGASSPVRPALNQYPCGVGHSSPSKQQELLDRASRFICQFVEGPVADRCARAQTCGVAMADQPGRGRHRGWRTTPKAPLVGKTQGAATAMP